MPAIPAKLNLFLEVLDKRPDGYHDLELLMVANELCVSAVIRLTKRIPMQAGLTGGSNDAAATLAGLNEI
jgi:4-diphosphocytidyl-2-C-methyl-D-erythritol kinase